MLKLTYSKQETANFVLAGYLSGYLAMLQDYADNPEFKDAYKKGRADIVTALKPLLKDVIDTDEMEKADDVSEYILNELELEDEEAFYLVVLGQHYLLYEKQIRENAEVDPKNKDDLIKNGRRFLKEQIADIPEDYVTDADKLTDAITQSKTINDFIALVIKYAE